MVINPMTKKAAPTAPPADPPKVTVLRASGAKLATVSAAMRKLREDLAPKLGDTLVDVELSYRPRDDEPVSEMDAVVVRVRCLAWMIAREVPRRCGGLPVRVEGPNGEDATPGGRKTAAPAGLAAEAARLRGMLGEVARLEPAVGNGSDLSCYFCRRKYARDGRRRNGRDCADDCLYQRALDETAKGAGAQP